MGILAQSQNPAAAAGLCCRVCCAAGVADGCYMWHIRVQKGGCDSLWVQREAFGLRGRPLHLICGLRTEEAARTCQAYFGRARPDRSPAVTRNSISSVLLR